MLESEEMVEVAALAMQKDFPVVRTGANEKGDWSVRPLELEVFANAFKAAIAAIIEKVRGDD